jgi:lipopolysaccharide/colanic/teichoic acid biosynthesis glycosyltransferase
MYLNDYVPKNAEMLNDGSDRVIPFCKFIRKAKLDEIPQMINIIKGEMSIVGPRAEWEKFVNVFLKEIPYYSSRMWVKTGWTGWAHVSMPAAYSVDEERERLAYDLYYIKHRNVLWEIGILVKAVFLAIGGRHL